MTRGEKVKRFLTGGILLIGGVLGLIFGSGSIMPYVIGGGLAFFGLIMMSEKSSKLPGFVSLVLGGLFIANPLLGWAIITYLAIGSLLGGAYLSYDTYKKINNY